LFVSISNSIGALKLVVGLKLAPVHSAAYPAPGGGNMLRLEGCHGHAVHAACGGSRGIGLWV